MANRKSMRGVEIDLGKLMARQEKNITVGNTCLLYTSPSPRD